MPSKRKLSCIDANVLPTKTTPPAPQKPGKLKSILKRPSSSSSRFLASTPSAQIKLEFHAAARNLAHQREESNAHATVPKTAKKPKLEFKPEMKPHISATPRRTSPSDPSLDIIEDSAAEPDLPKPASRKSNSPKYEDDGDTEDLVTDSKPQSPCSDDTLLMSGGLGPGESPYKRTINRTQCEPSEHENKLKRSLKTPGTSSAGSCDQAKRKQIAPPVSETKQQLAQALAVITKLEANEKVAPAKAHESDIVATKNKASDDARATSKGSLPISSPAVSAVPKTEGRTASPPLVSKTNNLASAANSNSQAVETIPPSRRLSRSERRKLKKGQSPILDDMARILSDYEETRKTEMETLRSELQSAQTKAAHLETQLDMLQREIASQSKARQTQHSWQLNKFAIFSRRSYSLQTEEDTRVLAGCDDLEEANGIARAIFQSEMDKLEIMVEDLGEASFFAEMDCGMAQIQMRSTSCGLSKCRAYHTDSQWDLTVERVAVS